MSFWGRLFGSDDVIGKTVDGVYNGVDKLVYTQEEKAERFERILKLYEPFKLAQRWIALMVGIPFVLIHVACSLIWVASIFIVSSDMNYAIFIGRLGEVITSNNETLGEPFGYIVIFYFMGGASEGVVKAFTERKK